MSEKRAMPQRGEVWKNWKTGDVFVAGLSKDSETKRTRVLYHHVNDDFISDPRPWDRPFLEWEEDVNRPADSGREAYNGPRFTKVADPAPGTMADVELELAGVRAVVEEIVQAASVLWVTAKISADTPEILSICENAWKDISVANAGIKANVMARAIREAMKRLADERDAVVKALKEDQESLAKGALDAQAKTELKLWELQKQHDEALEQIESLKYRLERATDRGW